MGEVQIVKGKRKIAVFLTLLLGLLSVGKDGSGWECFSEEIDGDAVAVPEIITEEEWEQNRYANRLKEMETDLNTLVFSNTDGNCVMRVFDHPVKYYDSSGEVRDITLEMEEANDGGFQTADNSIITTFSRRLEEGVCLSDSDVEIVMVPIVPEVFQTEKKSEDMEESTSCAALSESKKEVKYDFEGVSYVYALTYTGFKEDIVVEAYADVTEYSFELYTNGLTLREVQGELYLYNGDTPAATLGDVIVFTADEKNNRLCEMDYVTLEASQKYLLTIYLDEEYLKDPNTVYPIRIDPTIEITYSNSPSGIVDVTISENASSSITSGSLYVGKRSSEGVSRVLMKFPGLNLSSLSTSTQIISASVELRDLMCESTAMTVYCYVFKGNTWASGNCDWDDVNANQYSPLLDSKTVSYSNGAALGTVHRYSFDITNAVIGWKSGTYSQSKGILFKASSTVESASSNTYKTFASYNRSAYQPSLTVIYSNPFLAYKGDTAAYIDSTDYASLQKRANCYGFALRMYYTPDAFDEVDDGAYKQQPGEFADKSLLTGISNYNDLYNAYVDKICGSGLTIDFIMSFVRTDMATLGYQVLSTAKYTSASQIPSAGNANKRLILLVVGTLDFHFYLQNSDNTWSHKPGSSEAKNVCNAHGTTLTNANILSHMQESGYDKDYLFFYVDKPAQIDYGHLKGHNDDSVQTSLSWIDSAGSNQNTAERIYPTSNLHYGRFDGKDDVDYYAFCATFSGTQTVPFSLNTGEAVVINVFSTTSTSPIAWTYLSAGSGSVSFTVVKGAVYYLCFDYAGAPTYSSQRGYNFKFTQ